VGAWGLCTNCPEAMRPAIHHQNECTSATSSIQAHAAHAAHMLGSTCRRCHAHGRAKFTAARVAFTDGDGSLSIPLRARTITVITKIIMDVTKASRRSVRADAMVE
jgi:hypothetical protein